MKTLITIGHPAYEGANAYRRCFSKAQAVRVLRNRGFKRDDAREIINHLPHESNPWAVTSPEGRLIEVVDDTNKPSIWDYSMMRLAWSKQSEF
ncbi:MAG: hypothetical protein WCL08_13260 [Verrucomicrobiota bacterium]